MNKKIQRGFIDPLSLIGVVFLFVTLITATAVTTNPNITQKFRGKAAVATCNGYCVPAPEECDKPVITDTNCKAPNPYCCGTKTIPTLTPTSTPVPTPPEPPDMPLPPDDSCTNEGSCTDSAADCCSKKAYSDKSKCNIGLVCGIKPTPTPTSTPQYTCALTSDQLCIDSCSSADGYCPGSGTCRDGLFCCKECSTGSSPIPTPTGIGTSCIPTGECTDTKDECCSKYTITNTSKCGSTGLVCTIPGCISSGCLPPGKDCCAESYTDTMCQPTETRCGTKPATPTPITKCFCKYLCGNVCARATSGITECGNEFCDIPGYGSLSCGDMASGTSKCLSTTQIQGCVNGNLTTSTCPSGSTCGGTPPACKDMGIYMSTTCFGKCDITQTCVSAGMSYYKCVKTGTITQKEGDKRCNGDNLETWNGSSWEWLYCDSGCDPDKLKCKSRPTGSKKWGETCSEDSQCESGVCTNVAGSSGKGTVGSGREKTCTPATAAEIAQQIMLAAGPFTLVFGGIMALPTIADAALSLYSLGTATLTSSPVLQTGLSLLTLSQLPASIITCELYPNSEACMLAGAGVAAGYFSDVIGSEQALQASAQQLLNAIDSGLSGLLDFSFLDDFRITGAPDMAGTSVQEALLEQKKLVDILNDPSNVFRGFKSGDILPEKMSAGGLREGIFTLDELLDTKNSTLLEKYIASNPLMDYQEVAGYNRLIAQYKEMETAGLSNQSIAAWSLQQKGVEISPYLSTSTDLSTAARFGDKISILKVPQESLLDMTTTSKPVIDFLGWEKGLDYELEKLITGTIQPDWIVGTYETDFLLQLVNP